MGIVRTSKLMKHIQPFKILVIGAEIPSIRAIPPSPQVFLISFGGHAARATQTATIGNCDRKAERVGTCAICVIINALHLLSTCTTPSKRRCQWWLLGTALAGIPLFTFRFAISTDLEDWRTWRIFWPPAVICVNFAGLEAVQEVAKAHFIYARNKLLVPKRLYWVYMGWGIYYVVLNIIILPIIFATNKQIFIEVLNMGEMLIILGPGMYTIYQLLTIYRFFRARVYHSRSDRQTGPISMAPTKQVASNPTVGAAQTASLLCGKPIYARDSSLSRFTRKDREMSLSYKNRGGENDVKLVVKTKETGREEGTLTTDTSPQSFNYGNRHSTGSPGSIVTSDRQSATQGSQLSNMKNPSGSPLSSTKKNPNGSPLSSTKKKNGSPLSSMKKSSIGSLLSTTQKKSLNGNVIDSTKTRDGNIT
ncbi:hypothetical protein AAMO2058_000685400 [Amorphochlora amoebiformis]